MNRLQKPLKITLIGESCRDIYRIGNVNRLSPEAPVPILEYEREEFELGMAANVGNNFRQLGIDFALHTIMMEDKIRFIDQRSNKQIMRMDVKTAPVVPISFAEVSLESDCIVISDYDKGYVTYEFVELLRQKFDGPMFIDTKKRDLKRFNGILIKINEQEYNNRISDGERMLVTYGGDNVVFEGKAYQPPKVELTDPCGAGDTFLAALVYASFATEDQDEMIGFAMDAAAITVRNLGVYAPTLQEITQ